jgi:hypothetical protein
MTRFVLFCQSLLLRVVNQCLLNESVSVTPEITAEVERAGTVRFCVSFRIIFQTPYFVFKAF